MLDRRPERSEIRRTAENGSHLRETGCVGPSVTIPYAPPAHISIVKSGNYHTEDVPGGNREYIIRPDGTINYTLRWELVFPLPPRLPCFFFSPPLILLSFFPLFSFLSLSLHPSSIPQLSPWLPLSDSEPLLFVPPLLTSRPCSPLLSTVCAPTRPATRYVLIVLMMACLCSFLFRVADWVSELYSPSRRPSPTTFPVRSRRSRSSGSMHTCSLAMSPTPSYETQWLTQYF